MPWHYLLLGLNISIQVQLQLIVIFLPSSALESTDSDRADKACLECQNDLSSAGCREIREACINPGSANANALWYPNALPERVKITAYMNEFLFLVDGIDTLTGNKWDEWLKSLDIFEKGQAEDFRVEKFDEKCPNLEALTEISEFRGLRGLSEKAMKSIKARIFAELLEADEILGRTVIDEYKHYLQRRAFGWSGTYHKFDNLDEYLEFRIIDAGTW